MFSNALRGRIPSVFDMLVEVSPCSLEWIGFLTEVAFLIYLLSLCCILVCPLSGDLPIPDK